MPITLGDTSITGLGVGGLPAGTVNSTTLADSAVTAAKMGYSGAIIQTQYVSSGTRVQTTHSSTWAEPSTAYRVTITPIFANSMIIVKYYALVNQNSGSNVLTAVRAFRSIAGGAIDPALTSAGSTNGTRQVVAGGIFRPGNGYDLNDQNMLSWQVVDFPNTTSSIAYGFQTRPEGGNTSSWGYAASTDGNWSSDADIVIIAQEIKQ